MNLKNDTGVSPFVIAAIVVSCAAPAGVLNVWPRIEQMLSEGFSGHQLGVVLLVSLSALGMTSIPFAMNKTDNWGFWTTCLVFGIFLAGLNYALAVGAIGKGRDHESNTAEALIAQGNKLQERISSLKAAQSALGSFKWTTEEMLQSARQAVELAKQARDQECGRVGDNCRARVAQLSSRQAEIAELSATRALTTKSEGLTRSLLDTERDLATLGSIPKVSDPQAERLGSLLQLVGVSLRTEAVATGLIHVLAIAAELFGLLMPRVLVTALGTPKVLVALGGPSAGTTAPALLAPPKAISKAGPHGPSAVIADWKSQSLRARKGEKLNTWQAFQAYKKWAESRGYAPGSFTQFCFELGLPKEEEAGKTYFNGWSLQ